MYYEGAREPGGALVRLEEARLGSRWVTTREALGRFMTALTPKLDGCLAAPTPLRAAPATRQ